MFGSFERCNPKKPSIAVTAFCFIAFCYTVSVPNTVASAQAVDDSSRDRNDNATIVTEPRFFPDTLDVNSKRVSVRFKVHTLGNPRYVRLNETTRGGVYDLNDDGRDGDRVANDGIFGALVSIARTGLNAGDCLWFEAFTGENGNTRSLATPLCATSLPGRISRSNLAAGNRVDLANGAQALGDELMLRFSAEVNETLIEAIASEIGASVVGGIRKRRLYQIRFARPQSLTVLKSHIEYLRTRPGVENAALNLLGQAQAAPNDPEFQNQHGLPHIRADQVWDIGTGQGVTITVLDSGINSNHPEFNEGGGNCKLVGGCNVGDDDSYGHGTAVAAIAAAFRDNGIGIAGVAPDSLLQSIWISDAEGGVPLTEMVQGLQDAANTGVGKIVNASFALKLNEQPPAVDNPDTSIIDTFDLCAAIDEVVVSQAGVPLAVVVNAVGNHSSGGWAYPARCNDDSAAPNVNLTRKDLFIVVGNSTSCISGCTRDQRFSSSNYGPYVDLFAPGAAIRSIIDTGYGNITGSSFSAPMVAGTAAILNACGVPLEQLEGVMVNSAPVQISYPANSDPAFPAGSTPRADAYSAMESINDTPTGVTISQSGIEEGIDTGGGFSIGSLATIDSDTCDMYSYSILPGGDGSLFQIGGADMDELLIDNGTINAAPDSFSVTVRSTDFFGQFFDQTLTINVNILPTADAGPDQAVDEGDPVNLDGTGSTDPDGTITAFNWTRTDTTGISVTLTGADTATPSFNAPAVAANATLTFSLVVTDNDGTDSVTDSVDIAVSNTDEIPPTPPPDDGDEDVSADQNTNNGDESDGDDSSATGISPALILYLLLLAIAVTGRNSILAVVASEAKQSLRRKSISRK